jgi:methylaspartate mutase sigma subunit
MDKKTVVIGVIGADAHAVGNKIIDLTLTNHGFNVVNLGVMVSQEEFIEAAVETSADAILVSSLYGHGEIDCMGLREKCDEAGLKGILLYAGGKLVVGKVPEEEIVRRYKALGFDRAFGPGTDPQVDIDCLKEDLGLN